MTINSKKVGLVSAIALGVSSMIGSGWLFAPEKAAQVAGSGAIFAWLIGAVLVGLLGLCFAEIAALFPKRGLSAIIPSLSHNRYFAFPFAIANWLGVVAVIALEADACVQYLINLFPTWSIMFYQQGDLTRDGELLAIVLVIMFGALNYWGAKLLVKSNNVFTAVKLFVPIVVALVIISHQFHPQNFTTVNHSVLTYGIGSVLSAVVMTGIIVAFNGFQTVISFASEVENPARTIPLSISIAIIASLLVYLLLQTAFIGAMPSDMLNNGWHQLQMSAPVVQLLGLIGLGLWTSVVYVGATVSPCGSGMAFAGSASRMFTAMASNRQMPTFFAKINPLHNVSRRSLVINVILAAVILLSARSWERLAEILSLIHIISYLPVPIALWVFRRQLDQSNYQFRLPFGKFIAFALFIFFSYLVTLADMMVVEELFLLLLMFQLIYIGVNTKNLAEVSSIVKKSWSVWLYFLLLFWLALASPMHHHWFSQADFFIFLIVLSSLAFYAILKSARQDVQLESTATVGGELPIVPSLDCGISAIPRFGQEMNNNS